MHAATQNHGIARRPRAIRSLAPVAVLLLAGCGGLFEDDDNAPVPARLEAIESEIDVDELWSRRTGSGEGRYRLAIRPAIAGGRVFTAGYRGDVAAHDAVTGKPVWEADTEVPVSGGPGAGHGLVVVGSSSGDVVALSAADGEIAWKVQVSSEVLSAPAVGERVVVVRSIDGTLFGLNAATGERLWIYDRTVPVLTLRGTSAPVIAGDIVIAGFDSGHLDALSLADGRLVWEAQVATATGSSELERLVDIDADPVVYDGIVYVVTHQGRVAAFDLDDGQELWQRPMSSREGIGLGGPLLYVTDDTSHVWALDRRSGASLWRQDALDFRRATRPVVFGDYVVVADYQGHVHWLSAEDGRFVDRVRAGSGEVHAPPVTAGEAVYVLGKSGRLTAYTVP